MRIAILSSSARIAGGVERYLARIIPMLIGAGHDVAMLCQSDTPVDRQRIAPGSRLLVWCADRLGSDRALEALRQWSPEVIYSHGLGSLDLEARALSLAPGVVFAHDYSATCISGAKSFALPAASPCSRRFGSGCLALFYPRRCGGLNPLTMWNDYRLHADRLALMRRYRALVTASIFLRTEYLRHGFAASAVRCVGLPVDSSPGPARATNGEAARLPSRVLFAGRMEAPKGGLLLLQAMPLAAAALNRDLKLVFAGDGRDRAIWQGRAEAVTVAEPRVQIDFCGWLDGAALEALYDSSDLLAVPSVWPEPFGLVGPEAGRRGVPAAAFAVGGIPEWLCDGVNGHLASATPPAAAGLAAAIAKCLCDPGDHDRLRRGAIEMAKRFSPDRHLAALIEVFEDVAGTASHRHRDPLSEIRGAAER